MLCFYKLYYKYLVQLIHHLFKMFAKYYVGTIERREGNKTQDFEDLRKEGERIYSRTITIHSQMSFVGFYTDFTIT